MSEPRRFRFFAETLPLQAGAAIPLSVEEAHHALHVLRLREGEAAELSDGRGGRCRGHVFPGKKGAVSIIIDEVLPSQPRRAPAVHLAFAVPKGKRLDWLLEKATELAAASLQPVLFERSVAGGDELSENKRSRWLGHCVAAAKQSGLNHLPEIHEPVPLGDYIAGFRGLGLFGDLGPGAVTVPEALAGGAADITVLVGPEGGLSDGERDAILAAGFRGARLGRTTLRVETAAVALLAAVTAQCGSDA